jgi:betaine-aldehyde dehydrogenase
VEPTVFSDVKPTMRIAREEIFGPMLAVLPWSDLLDLYPRSFDRAPHRGRGAMAVQAGYVWVSEGAASTSRARPSAVGGVRQSAFAREEMLRFTQEKNINVRLRPKRG